MDDTQARGPDQPGAVREAAGAATDAASTVASTAKDQAMTVADEARTQARTVMEGARERLTIEAHTQSDRLADGIRQAADELNRMVGDSADSPARKVVSRVADGGHQLADYLSKNGPDGVMAEVQEFARRRPAAFLATALVAGLVVGQLGKSVLTAGGSSPDRGAAGTDSMPFTGTAAVPAYGVESGSFTETDAFATPPGQRDHVEPPHTRATP